MVRRFIVHLLFSMFVLTSACSPSGSPTPVLDSQGTYSLETRTGIADVDPVIAAVASGDRAQIESLISYTTAPCTTREGFGGPPKCKEGEAEGTMIEAVPMISSEGGFIRKEELDIWTGVDATALFAVYKVSEDGVEEEYYPRGEYAVVFLSNENGVGITPRIIDGRIVRVDYPFYVTWRELKDRVEQDASEVILTPDVR